MSSTTRLTGAMVRAARALLGIGQADLAEKSKVSVATIARIEKSSGAPPVTVANLEAIRVALEEAGVVLIQDGVRLRVQTS